LRQTWGPCPGRAGWFFPPQLGRVAIAKPRNLGGYPHESASCPRSARRIGAPGPFRLLCGGRERGGPSPLGPWLSTFPDLATGAATCMDVAIQRPKCSSQLGANWLCSFYSRQRKPRANKRRVLFRPIRFYAPEARGIRNFLAIGPESLKKPRGRGVGFAVLAGTLGKVRGTRLGRGLAWRWLQLHAPGVLLSGGEASTRVDAAHPKMPGCRGAFSN